MPGLTPRRPRPYGEYPDVAAPQQGPHPQEPTQYDIGGPANDPNSSIGLVEHHAAGLLPTRVILDIAGLSVDDKAKALAARKMARQWDVSPQVFFGERDPRKVVSRITGTPVTMKDALRFTDRFAPVAIASMLTDIVPQHRGQTRRSVGEPSYDRIASFANAIARSQNIDLQAGVGLAYQLARNEKFDPKVFAANLDLVTRWAATSKETVPIDFQAIASIAIAMSRKGKGKSMEDVAKFVYGDRTVGVNKEFQRTLQSEQFQQMTPGQQREYVKMIQETAATQQPTTDMSNLTAAALSAAESVGGAPAPGITETPSVIPTDMAGTLGPDYWKQVQEVQDRVQANNEAFQRSLLGKTVNATIGTLTQYWHAVEKGVGDIGYVLTGSAALGIAALDPNSDVKGTWENIIKSHADYYRRIEANQTIGDIVQEGWGNRLGVDIPDAFGTAFDFVAGYYIDPLTIVTKGATIARASRSFVVEEPTLLRNLALNVTKGDEAYAALLRARMAETLASEGKNAEQIAKILEGFGTKEFKDTNLIGRLVGKRLFTAEDLRVNRLKNYVIEDFPKSTLSRRLFDAAGESESRYFRRLAVETRGAVQSKTLDFTYMQLLRNNMIERFGATGLKGPEAWQAWQDGIRAHFVGYGPEGSVAEATVLQRLANTQITKDAAEEILLKAEQQVLDYGNVADRLFLPERGLSNEWHYDWMSTEIPNATGIGRFGLRRGVRALATNERFTETSLGKRVAAIPNVNPGRQMPLFGDGTWEYALQHSTRWSTFSQREVQGFAAEIRNITASGVRVNDRIEALVSRINSEALDRVLQPYNLTEDARKALHEQAFGDVNRLNSRAQTFGAYRNPVSGTTSALTKPILESQLRNFLYVVDPVEVRAGVREYLGLLRRTRTHLYNVFSESSPEIAGKITGVAGKGHDATLWVMDRAGGLVEGTRHVWKALTVARPGYIPRVILGDENARFLSTTHSVFERLASQQWFGATGFLDRTGAFTREFRGPTGEVFARVGLPGAYERNALAEGAIRQTEIMDGLLKDAGMRYQGSKVNGVGWELVDPLVHPTLAKTSLTWSLSKQMPNSAPGRIALESVAAGDSVLTTQQKLLAWAEQDRYVTLRGSLGVTPERTADWANQLASVTHSYTMDSPALATASLRADAKDIRQIIEQVPEASLPWVHGPSVEGITKGIEDVAGSKFLNWNYKTWVQGPESHLNRQPFYTAMKRRASEGMLSFQQHIMAENPEAWAQLRREGVEAKLWSNPTHWGPADQLEAALAGQADEFYYHRTRANPDQLVQDGLIAKPPPEARRWETAQMSAERRVEPRVYFSSHPDMTMGLTPGGDWPGPMLRVRRGAVSTERGAFAVGTGDQAIPVEFFTTQNVPADAIEFFAADGKWHPLTDAATTTRLPLDPHITASIDAASTRFALEQVNKVMFDLTKQSRFTELLQFAFPFPQPFFEGFQAWGHLIRRNPAIIARATSLYRLGKETGFIKTDPLTGEEVVNLAPIAGLTKVLLEMTNALPGHPGISGSEWDKLGIKFIAPLTSFNMLSSTTFKVGGGTWVGKLIGGVPLPMPGLRPEVSALMQYIFRNTHSEALTSALFQYGPSTQFAPRQLQAVLSLINPDVFGDKSAENRLVLSLLRAYQVSGAGFDANGDPISEDELLRQAKRDAQALTLARAFGALFSPASPRVQTVATEYEALFQTYVDKYPNDYGKALDEWTKDHPKLWLIPVGKSLPTGGFTNQQTGDTKLPPRLPASRVIAELLNTPGIGDLMKGDKLWGGILALGVNPDLLNEQDYPTFARLLADGSYRYKTPEEFFQQGENTPIYARIDEFYKTVWNPTMAALDAKGVDNTDTAYTDLVTRRKSFFASLYNDYPNWVATNLSRQEVPEEQASKLPRAQLYLSGINHDDTGYYTYDWPSEDPHTTAWGVIADAKHFVSLPGVTGTPGGQALQGYLDLRDKIEAKMVKEGFTSVTQVGAEKFAAQYSRGVQALYDAHPGFDQYLGALLGVRIDDAGLHTEDLQHVNSSKLTDYASIPVDLRPSVAAFDTRQEVLSAKPYDAATKPERSQAFLELQTYIDTQYASDPKVVKGWWTSLGATGRQEYIQSLATKPPEFYNAWDWHQAGVDLKGKAASYWEQIAQARIDIANQTIEAKANGDTKFSAGALYDQLNAWVADRMKSNKSFAQSVAVANSWAFPFEAAQLDKMPGKVGHNWGLIIDAAKQLQQGVDLMGLAGTSFDTTENIRFYVTTQQQLNYWIKGLRDNSAAFNQSWLDFQHRLPDPIVGSLIMPDSYFGPLGDVNYGK